MKTGRRSFGVVVVMTVFASVVCGTSSGASVQNASGTGAAVSAKKVAQLEVRVDSTTDISVLSLSRSALAELGLELREIPSPKAGAWNPTRERSIVAALAMSLGIAGAVFVRRKKTAAMLFGALAALVVGTAAMQVRANMSPPPAPSPLPKYPVVIQTYTGADLNVGTRAPKQLDAWRVANPERYKVLLNGKSLLQSSVSEVIHVGVNGLSQDFASLLELKPASNAIRLERAAWDQSFDFAASESFRGGVAVEITDGDRIRLSVGRKSAAAAEAAAASAKRTREVKSLFGR